ncbi:MAG: RNA polymerase subunit sigma-70 [Candidatus Zixiibacteriota bacterium]|nr:MAG: RNA polymerase subunit sigma-70 [candidate division Zixibacteria bacterium]
MAKDWQELTKMTGGEPIVVERVRLTNKDMTVEGSFDLPPLARLTMEDQIFTAAFVQSHGSIKDMEYLFGVSYPTIKNRLNRISRQLDFIDVQKIGPFDEADLQEHSGISNILDRLESGEISTKKALDILKSRKEK